MKNKKNNLDEMQEQKLLNIEKNGVWFVFWALLASIIIQGIIYDDCIVKAVAGEWIVFMCLCVYMLAACLKNGIWDRRLKANRRTNICISSIAALCMGLINGVQSYFKYDNGIKGAILTGIVMFISVFVLCLIALEITMKAYKKRLSKLEDTEEK